ncbi:MAG: hypothetical protein M1131_06450 [Actinobacteria bacterium]|nr:hypothetical protein [Actinomycetota bacterium]MCL6094232.1 hypothetical protein [Actinomycetota bacterium]
MTSASNERSTVERVLDVLVYAPIGLAIATSEEVPKLASKGRTRIEAQLATARTVGELAANYGIQRVDKHIKQVLSAGLDRYLGFKYPNQRAEQRQPDQHHDDASTSTPVDQHKVSDNPTTEVKSVDKEGEASNRYKVDVSEGGVEEKDLAIPGYDALSASQVVQRLEGLSMEELRTVKEYEMTHRARRTILNKASQLLDEH